MFFAPCLILAHRLPSSKESIRRIETAIAAYYSDIISDIYITSSYQASSGIRVGYQIKTYLTKKTDIPIGRIHYVPYGRNTAGEIAGFIRALHKRNRQPADQKLWACTSDYHAQRVKMLLETYADSVEVLTAPSPLPGWKKGLKGSIEVLKIVKDSFFRHGRIKAGPAIEF